MLESVRRLKRDRLAIMSSVTTIETLPDSRSKTPSLVSEKQLPIPPRRRFWHVSWIWETLSLLLSISCITAVLILLLFYDNKPIPTWRFLTLNTAISILAVVAKSALLVPVAEVISQQKWYWFWGDDARPLSDFQRHDAASRGPWGSFVLLLRPRTWHLVSVGALVTVLALGMEPALQQVQTYAVRSVETKGQGSIARVDRYMDLEQDAGAYSLPLLGVTVKGAVYSGLFGSAARTQDKTDATCSTGNCTWPDYSTLAMCSACQNLTMKMQKDVQPDTWHLPKGFGHITSDQNMMVMQSSQGYTQLAYRPMNLSVALDTTMMFYPPSDKPETRQPQTYECILYFCVKTYKASMTNGTLSQELVKLWPNASSPDLASSINANGVAYIDPQAQQAFQVDATPYNLTWTLQPGPQQAEPGANFTINILTFELLRMWLGDLIKGQVYADPDTAGVVDDVSQIFYEQMTGTQGAITPKPNDPVKVAHMPGPEAIFARMADSITAYMLSMSKARVTGSSYTSETYVRARWAWAILPLALVTLTAMLLIATTVLSAKRDMPTWKSSALPALFHGLDEVQTAAIGACQTERTGIMEKRADGVRVSMCSEEGIVRLRATRRNTCV